METEVCWSSMYYKKSIPLVELINTYQGEGVNCGRKMVLTRFKKCDKRCPFCDTQVKMHDITPELYSLKDIDIMLSNSHNLMITGGEPTFDITPQGELSQFDWTCSMLKNLNFDFCDIETNGFRLINLLKMIMDYNYCGTRKVINISWSPKFIKPEDYCTNINILENLIELNYKNIIIKTVISDTLPEYKKFVYDSILKYKFNPNNVYLMPLGINIDEINTSFPAVLECANDLGCNISSRLHIVHNFT